MVCHLPLRRSLCKSNSPQHTTPSACRQALCDARPIFLTSADANPNTAASPITSTLTCSKPHTCSTTTFLSATLPFPLTTPSSNSYLNQRRRQIQNRQQEYRTSRHKQQVSSSKSDPFYGHEYISRLSAQFITHLFACPKYPPSTTHSQAKLPFFIAYALHHTKLHQSVTFAAFVLLQCLKARFPTACSSAPS
jgi:hypothetical protein